MATIFPFWVQDINILTDLLGFAITIVVMVQVNSLKASYKARSRLPEIVKDLESAGSKLNKCLGAWPADRNNGRVQIKVASSLVLVAIPFVAKADLVKIKSDHKKLFEAVGDFDNPKYNDVDVIWDLYTDIQSIITTLNQSIRNMATQ